ncbi:MAG: phage tail assembly protein [Alphaproteobacteria bacterium]|nr:phage tail assembly protein [Alphaproteobacteria bacterium]
MVKIDLTKPVKSEGGEISTLELREPIAEDIIACGYPFRLYVGSATNVDNADQQEMKIDTVVLSHLAARLANVPVSTIKRLTVSDFQKVVDAVSDFFG